MLETIDYMAELLTVGIDAIVSFNGSEVIVEFAYSGTNDILLSYTGDFDYCLKQGYDALRWKQ